MAEFKVGDRVKVNYNSPSLFVGLKGVISNIEFKYIVLLDGYIHTRWFEEDELELLSSNTCATAPKQSGARCRKCDDYNEYALQEDDGKYTCYGCKH